MVRFTDRNSVITHIKECTERRSIERAIEEGQVEYLGGFSQTSFNTRSPIWICRITSTYDKTWVVAVYTNGAITYLRSVPWEYYAGGSSNNTLYSGDNPKEYVGFRRLSYFKHKRKKEIPNEHATEQCKRDTWFSRILCYLRW